MLKGKESLWWYFASCWVGSHLLLLSGGSHHKDMAVSLQGIVAAVSGAAAICSSRKMLPWCNLPFKSWLLFWHYQNQLWWVDNVFCCCNFSCCLCTSDLGALLKCVHCQWNIKLHLIHAGGCIAKGHRPGGNCCTRFCYLCQGECWCDKACWFYRDCCEDIQLIGCCSKSKM